MKRELDSYFCLRKESRLDVQLQKFFKNKNNKNNKTLRDFKACVYYNL